MTGRETGSDALERAKTTVRWSENLADPSDTVCSDYIPWWDGLR